MDSENDKVLSQNDGRNLYQSKDFSGATIVIYVQHVTVITGMIFSAYLNIKNAKEVRRDTNTRPKQVVIWNILERDDFINIYDDISK